VTALIGSFSLALLLALVIAPPAIRFAWTVGYLDHPEARKLHTSATALLGGPVVFLSAIMAWGVALALTRRPPGTEAAYLVLGALVALAVGLWDDRFGMRPSIKLLGQGAAASLAMASGAIPPLGLPVAIEVFIALVALVSLMNAVNFLDNMNGMVGGLAAVLLAGFAYTSWERGAIGVAAAQLALVGACLGFLRYNFPGARMFLGDAGSLFLGYSLGASAVLAFRAAPAGWGRLGPLLMLGYPAFDMIFVVVSRLREGRKVYEGGKDHTNHRLARVIQCPKRTVLLIWFSMAALCASGLVILRLNQPLPALLLSGLWTVLFLWSGWKLSSIRAYPRSPTS
jgi:UDP-GlcNAc:undecaprenyl-phosphate GlcNAc-1-phosphate transferase